MERAYWATANVGPFHEHQVVVFDDEREPGAGWVRTGWFREIEPVRPVLDEGPVERLPDQLVTRSRGRRRRGN